MHDLAHLHELPDTTVGPICSNQQVVAVFLGLLPVEAGEAGLLALKVHLIQLLAEVVMDLARIGLLCSRYQLQSQLQPVDDVLAGGAEPDGHAPRERHHPVKGRALQELGPQPRTLQSLQRPAHVHGHHT